MHIEIKHHFINEYVQKQILDIKFVDTNHQRIDIFVKSLSEDRLNFIKENLNILLIK